ncbi:hypothetical protein R2917_004638 [Salmonella enterica]|nr:hypothetical protein [Salmonella enterica]EIK4080708.1 hypothetical protein [Salmonella enterica]ELQ8584866.1 hypothetical protein [Salmonella enterica]
MSYYDLYGFSGSNLSEARELLESILNIVFCERDSTYHGGVYYLSGDKKYEHFILKENIDLFDNEPDEIDYPEYNYLLYINGTSRSSELKHEILNSNKFILLRSENI